MNAPRPLSVPENLTASTGDKRLFILLSAGSALLVCLLLSLAWLIPFLDPGRIHPAVPYVASVLGCVAGVAVLGLILTLIRELYAGPGTTPQPRLRGLAMRLFLPLAELLGRAVGCSPERIRRSFIAVNNDLVLRSASHLRPDQVLLLLPHCLQASACPRRVTHKPDNCVRCGKCVQGGLLDLRDRWQVQLAVATGGTLARRIVSQFRPRLILAVACERDLASGIQDTHPLPVFGVLNDRPFGPCLDTTLDLEKVEAVLARFLTPPLPSSNREEV